VTLIGIKMFEPPGGWNMWEGDFGYKVIFRYISALFGFLRNIMTSLHEYEQHEVCNLFLWFRELAPQSGEDNTEPDYLSVDFRRNLLDLRKWKWRKPTEELQPLCTHHRIVLKVKLSQWLKDTPWYMILALLDDRCMWTAVLQQELQEHALTLRRLMSYIYGAPILDVSRSHTTTQHSR